MSSVADNAPWQVGPVGVAARVAAGSLTAFALDSLFFWNATPHVLVSAAVVATPIVLAIRVVRGFRSPLLVAALMLAAGALVAGVLLVSANGAHRYPASAVSSAAAIGVVGAIASIVAWFDHRRTRRGAVIELERSESVELAPARTRRAR